MARGQRQQAEQTDEGAIPLAALVPDLSALNQYSKGLDGIAEATAELIVSGDSGLERWQPGRGNSPPAERNLRARSIARKLLADNQVQAALALIVGSLTPGERQIDFLREYLNRTEGRVPSVAHVTSEHRSVSRIIFEAVGLDGLPGLSTTQTPQLTPAPYVAGELASGLDADEGAAASSSDEGSSSVASVA